MERLRGCMENLSCKITSHEILYLTKKTQNASKQYNKHASGRVLIWIGSTGEAVNPMIQIKSYLSRI